MPSALANSDVRMSCSITEYSQNANLLARGFIHIPGNDTGSPPSHNANMSKEGDSGAINGGPNHLRAWMAHRGVKGAQLAEALQVAPSMVSDLVNSNRRLSARWLRLIAPVLGVTPGLLLDFHPNDIDGDVIDMWSRASLDKKRLITKTIKVIASDG